MEKKKDNRHNNNNQIYRKLWFPFQSLYALIKPADSPTPSRYLEPPYSFSSGSESSYMTPATNKQRQDAMEGSRPIPIYPNGPDHPNQPHGPRYKPPKKPDKEAESLIVSSLLNSDGLNQVTWANYPPNVTSEHAPLGPPKHSPATGLLDFEALTDEHIKQSTALRGWIEEAHEDRMNLHRAQRHIATQAPDEQTRLYSQNMANDVQEGLNPDLVALARADRAVIDDIKDTYSNFMNIEGCENHAAARHHASEILRRQKPTGPPSKVERLLGSDGSSPLTPDLPTENQLYFVGSPLKMTKIPFDKAVAFGLENLGRSSPDNPSSPVSGTQLSSPASLFPIEPTLALPSRPIIPDWFAVLDKSNMIKLHGADPTSRWNSLLGLMSSLDKQVEQDRIDATENKPIWDKVWHDPDDCWPYSWPFPHQRAKGGFWRCRSGPDAPEAERYCFRCHVRFRRSKQQLSAPKPEEQLQKVMDAIMKAMGEVAERDKIVAMHMMQGKGDKSDDEISVKDLRLSTGEADGEDDLQRDKHYNLLRGCEDVTYNEAAHKALK
ncbi:hypothetical protein GGR54DRAFT_639721 [Hypoxylon sp. NC1633]|nr:hypothetical protein GGR54DRAFT_639721 [Hypoxylon sp. NC1633]